MGGFVLCFKQKMFCRTYLGNLSPEQGFGVPCRDVFGYFFRF